MPNQFSKIWTPELDAQLLELSSHGASKSQIAKVMGFSRGKVAGKLNRLKQHGGETVEVTIDESLIDPLPVITPLEHHPISAIPKVPSHASSGSFRPSIHLPASKLPPPRPSISSLFLPLVDLSANSCRFVVGGGTCCDISHLFCGAPTYTAPTHEHHSPYCKTHYKMAYTRGY